jgi:predicted transcriptional regulator of viral defense system
MSAGLISQRILRIAARRPILRPRDLEARGIPREYLLRLYRKGLLERAGRGVYVVAGARVTEHHGLAVVAKQAPKGVICLLSALRFHGLTTQEPHEVWIAVANKAHRPQLPWPALKVVRFSGRALTDGIEHHLIESVHVRVFAVAKTVADCFKYRNKIGVDVAVEALRDALRQKRATVDEIFRSAKVCRVARVMRPYLEAVA